jgi:hypothetical protein
LFFSLIIFLFSETYLQGALISSHGKVNLEAKHCILDLLIGIEVLLLPAFSGRQS